MYPFFRLCVVMVRSVVTKKRSLESAGEIAFRCRPWDIDTFMEMNNGRVLTLFDLGRYDLIMRSKFLPAVKEKKWGFVVAGSTVRYRKRVRLFDKVTVRTRIIGFDDRWFYLEQSMWVKGQPTSSALIRAGITSKGRVVETGELTEALNITPWNYDSNGWVESWIESEERRPWPPG